MTQARGAALRLPTRRAAPRLSLAGRGLTTAYLSLTALVPLAAVVVKSTDEGWSGFWHAISTPSAVAALKLTFGISFVVVAINALMGTVIAWMLVRDEFRGKSVVNSIIDLPF